MKHSISILVQISNSYSFLGLTELSLYPTEKTRMILEIGQILMFQKLEVSVVVLRVVDVSVLIFGKLYQRI